MSWSLKHPVLLLFGSLVALGFPCAHAMDQGTGALIIYKEAEDANQTFTFSADPVPGAFQIATSLGEGARILDLPLGVSCTLTEMPQPGWDLTEIYCDGSGNWTADVAQARVTVILASSGDFVYCRFTSQKAPQPMDEASFLGVPATAVGLASLSAAFLPMSGGKARHSTCSSSHH